MKMIWSEKRDLYPFSDFCSNIAAIVNFCSRRHLYHSEKIARVETLVMKTACRIVLSDRPHGQI